MTHDVSGSRRRNRSNYVARLLGEAVERRRLLAVTASFNSAGGQLNVFGDALANTITLSRDAAGTILVNGGAVAVSGGTPTVANTALVQVLGQDGADTITLDESAGALPKALIFGGNQNDVITGGSGNDTLNGDAGNDSLLGRGGDDTLLGGTGNDTLTGGDASDFVDGEADDDRSVWNPGDDTDVVEGNTGIDTVEVNGGNGAETFALTANGTRVRFDRITPAPFSIDIGTAEAFVLNMNSGTDGFSATGNLASLLASVILDGGNDGDTITGTNAADVIQGGDGNDSVSGLQGNDTLSGGAGTDVFTWNPGDASDTIEGQADPDVLQFNGANISETINVGANGARTRITRDIAAVVLDVNDVEQVGFAVVGGADRLTVDDLASTDVTLVNIDLRASAGGGDVAADTVSVVGSAGADAITLFTSGTTMSIAGTAASVQVTQVESTVDSIAVNGAGGTDSINASAVLSGFAGITLSGGTDNDSIVGSPGVDTIRGDGGNDTINGGAGNDVVDLGADDDLAIWAPGSGNDTIEAGTGNDTLDFNGANVAERVSVSPNGTRQAITRDIATVGLDLNAFETFSINLLAGADSLAVNDMLTTGLTSVVATMGSSVSGDASVDTVEVNGLASSGAVTVRATDSFDTVNVNTDGVGSAVVAFDQAVTRIGTLNLGTSGNARIAANGSRVLVVNTFNTTITSRVDVTDNAMILDYASATPVGVVRSLLNLGYAGGTWFGNGIISTVALTTPGTAVGFGEATSLFSTFPATFAGQSVDSTSVLLRYTYAGDATLNRTVDFDDLLKLAANYNTSLVQQWTLGDFDYTATVNFDDLLKLASNYNKTLALGAPAPLVASPGGDDEDAAPPASVLT